MRLVTQSRRSKLCRSIQETLRVTQALTEVEADKPWTQSGRRACGRRVPAHVGRVRRMGGRTAMSAPPADADVLTARIAAAADGDDRFDSVERVLAADRVPLGIWPGTGRLLARLVVTLRPRSILEFGAGAVVRRPRPRSGLGRGWEADRDRPRAELLEVELGSRA